MASSDESTIASYNSSAGDEGGFWTHGAHRLIGWHHNLDASYFPTSGRYQSFLTSLLVMAREDRPPARNLLHGLYEFLAATGSEKTETTTAGKGWRS